MPSMVDGTTLKLADLDLEFIATNASGMQSKLNPERALIRHNWLEIFVRLCQTKYIKNGAGGTAKTWTECLTMMLNDVVIPYFKQFDSHAWRRKVCWQENVDYVLKKSLPVLKDIFKRNSGRYAAPGAPKFMSLFEFIDMLELGSVLQRDFNIKLLPQMFNLAMMTQVEEIESDRHLNMTFTEFLEALVRVAEKIEMPHLIDVSLLAF